MNIAINTVSFSGQDYSLSLIKKIISKAAIHYPEHQFYFLTDNAIELKNPGSSNLYYHIFKKRNPLHWFNQWLMNRQLSGYVKKMKIQLVIQADGLFSNGIPVPQWLFKHSEAELKLHTGYIAGFCKLLRRQQNAIQGNQCRFIQLPKNHETNVSCWEADVRFFKEKNIPHKKNEAAIKEKYTQGQDYFIYVGAVSMYSKMIQLLKAFTIFKNWQKSGLKLLLLDTGKDKDWVLEKELERYKLKAEVILLRPEEISSTNDLLANAYAAVFPNNFESGYPAVIQMMEQQIPVVIPDGADIKKNFGDTLFYASGDEVNGLAQQMIEVYKNEKQRTEQLQKANAFLNDFDEDASLRPFGHFLEIQTPLQR